MGVKDITALVLDDNAHMRSLLRTILLGFGIRRVVDAADAAEAFEEVRTNQIDLVFVDYRLQDLDGLEFCRLLRNAPDSPNPYLPIVMVSAYSEKARVMEAVNSGVDEFLVKPVSAVDLANRINAVIDRRRPFVRSKNYFGPDRRRRIDPKYRGPMRRMTDPGTFDL